MGLLLFGLMGNAISICLLCLHFLKLICYYLGQWEIFFFQNENSFIIFPDCKNNACLLLQKLEHCLYEKEVNIA